MLTVETFPSEFIPTNYPIPLKKSTGKCSFSPTMKIDREIREKHEKNEKGARPGKYHMKIIATENTEVTEFSSLTSLTLLTLNPQK